MSAASPASVPQLQTPGTMVPPSSPDHVMITVAGLDEVNDPARQTFVHHLTVHGQDLLNEASRLEERQRGIGSSQPQYITDHFDSAVVIMRTPYATRPTRRKWWWWLIFGAQVLATTAMTISAAFIADGAAWPQVLVGSTVLNAAVFILFGVVGGKHD